MPPEMDGVPGLSFEGIRSGLGELELELGFRLRYELWREFAPYAGLRLWR